MVRVAEKEKVRRGATLFAIGLFGIAFLFSQSILYAEEKAESVQQEKKETRKVAGSRDENSFSSRAIGLTTKVDAHQIRSGTQDFDYDLDYYLGVLPHFFGDRFERQLPVVRPAGESEPGRRRPNGELPPANQPPPQPPAPDFPEPPIVNLPDFPGGGGGGPGPEGGGTNPNENGPGMAITGSPRDGGGYGSPPEGGGGGGGGNAYVPDFSHGGGDLISEFLQRELLTETLRSIQESVAKTVTQSIAETTATPITQEVQKMVAENNKVQLSENNNLTKLK
ncbi:MAG: hypothetical protein HY582_02940 [Candidatus Omnitrophica bacterium]|nr:hypothetical protein [Candidatus Omnitrophota bacterium]